MESTTVIVTPDIETIASWVSPEYRRTAHLSFKISVFSTVLSSLARRCNEDETYCIFRRRGEEGGEHRRLRPAGASIPPARRLPTGPIKQGCSATPTVSARSLSLSVTVKPPIRNCALSGVSLPWISIGKVNNRATPTYLPFAAKGPVIRKKQITRSSGGRYIGLVSGVAGAVPAVAICSCHRLGKMEHT